MNKFFTPYIYILFFSWFSHGIFAQKLSLKFVGKDSIETNLLNRMPYLKNHKSKQSLISEVNSVHQKIKRKGFFTSTVENITEDKSNYLIEFSLGKRIEELVIVLPKAIGYNFQKKDSIKIKTEELENVINQFILELDNGGHSFSEIKLDKPIFENDLLFLHLKTTTSRKRVINRVVVKGYDDFPYSFIKNHYKINTRSVFSKQKLKDISLQTNFLNFVEEIKPPEVLFKRDSTILYLFLKKTKSSSIDGIINFASNESNDKTLINGNIDLKLLNILNTGENFELFWNRVSEQKSEFKIYTRVPFIFNSPISTSFRFNIYRQDSTFLNTRFDLNADYQLSSQSSVSSFYSSEKSDYLLDNSDALFDSFTNYFFGVRYHFTKPSNSKLFRKKVEISIAPSIGKRNGDNFSSNQTKITLNSELNFTISPRSYINFKSETGYLASEQFLTNEVFRIGGANSIRGFNEQSIFTDKFTIFNTEYRFQLANSSFLYTISDLGFFNNLNLNKIQNLIGIGFGYSFRVNNNQIRLGYALGKTTNSSFDFNNSKLIISWKSFF